MTRIVDVSCVRALPLAAGFGRCALEPSASDPSIRSGTVFGRQTYRHERKPRQSSPVAENKTSNLLRCPAGPIFTPSLSCIVRSIYRALLARLPVFDATG
jgi:hypothetical protein